MIGQAVKRGQLNPERGHSAEDYLPLPLDPLNLFGMAAFLRPTLSIPYAFNRAARGIRASSQLKASDALSNVSNKLSELNIYNMPTVLVVTQLPRVQRSQQDRRLPLNMVAPRFAWSPQ